jgi:hypothetical protein
VLLDMQTHLWVVTKDTSQLADSKNVLTALHVAYGSVSDGRYGHGTMEFGVCSFCGVWFFV